jgi:hypothetical protein
MPKHYLETWELQIRLGRMEMLCKRWLDINEEISYRKVLSCTKK